MKDQTVKSKREIPPFTAQELGNVCIWNGRGKSDFRFLNNECYIEVFGDCIKMCGLPNYMIPKAKEAILEKWPMATFEEKLNALVVSCKVPDGQDNGAPNRKVAIVGAEGSGKTVMLAGLGALYSRPDEKGYFLTPKDLETVSYVNRQMLLLQSGKWPGATVGDAMQGLSWDLHQQVEGGRPKKVCELSFLDFPGEVYRSAFARKMDANQSKDKVKKDERLMQVDRLKKYLAEADDVLVLVNLCDVIKYGAYDQRVEESVWITNAILDYVIPEQDAKGRKSPNAAIVLSQSDSYRNTIEACGGPKGTLLKYLNYVAYKYGWLETFAVCTVDKTVLDKDGNPIPAPDFTTRGLMPIIDWILGK